MGFETFNMGSFSVFFCNIIDMILFLRPKRIKFWNGDIFKVGSLYLFRSF